MAPPHRGLPDEIAIWEILIRLPPKPLLRCRAVCRAWRCATSARDFLLAHHARQPTHPILYSHERRVGDDVSHLGIALFDRRAADQLHSVVRLGHASEFYHPDACCDGLLLVSSNGNRGPYDNRFFICNPATRQYAPLPLVYGSTVWCSLMGMYPHSPTGDYRLLLRMFDDELDSDFLDDELESDPIGFYVFTLGSGQQPRQIGSPDADANEPLVYRRSVLFHGNLHWPPSVSFITVFDTTVESFRQMRAPTVPGYADPDLFEMGDTLGMFSPNDELTCVSIWAMEDYEGEVWALKYLVELPVAEIGLRGVCSSRWQMVVGYGDGDMFVLVRFCGTLFQVDINGELVASFPCRYLSSPLCLKQTLVSHTFFPTLEGYAVNASPLV